MTHHQRTAIEEARRRRAAPADQPRMYWVSFHRADGRRLLPELPYLIDLDLTPGAMAEEAGLKLTALLRGCITAANLHRPADIRGCYLELRQFTGAEQAPPGRGAPDMVWPVTWDPERE